MTALLALYMVQQLLLPGHAEHVLGLGRPAPSVRVSRADVGPAFASLIYGWYGGLVYFTPLFGGMIADRWLGTRTTVILGALLMSAGHLAMSFDQSFLIALALLILGSGCLKGNISAQVGQLYPREDESRRTQGFTIFSAGDQYRRGARAAGLRRGRGGLRLARRLRARGGADDRRADHLFGRPALSSRRPRSRRSGKPKLPPLTADERRRTWLLIAVIALAILPQIAYSMIWNVGIIWIDGHVSLATPFGTVPASWFNSVDSFASIVAVPPLVALWAWQARRRREPVSIAKMGIGSAINGVSALVFVAGCLLPGADGKVSVIWPLLAFTGWASASFITGRCCSRWSPKPRRPKVNSTLMGGAFLSLFVGNVLMGWVGSFYDEMTPGRLLDARRRHRFCRRADRPGPQPPADAGIGTTAGREDLEPSADTRTMP